MKAEAKVLQPGLFTSIQDFGRNGFRKFGVPASGAMDSYSAKMANLILQNQENDAVLEITQMGPTLEFSKAARIAICGASLSPTINGKALENNEAVLIEKGDVLSFGRRKAGCRAYLAIDGGFKTESVLGSLSWYEGLTENYRLQKDGVLHYNSSSRLEKETHAALKFNSDYLQGTFVEVYPGPEFKFLKETQQKQLQDAEFSISKDNNRMAIQLSEKLENNLESILTAPVLPGTVQLTPAGKLIVLMRDGQTTGGYPRVLQLHENGINALAQKMMQEKVRFRFL